MNRDEEKKNTTIIMMMSFNDLKGVFIEMESGKNVQDTKISPRETSR